jgi:hypothetical protein
MADPQMNTPVPKSALPDLPGDAVARVAEKRGKATLPLAAALDAFWINCPHSLTKRVSASDLAPLFARYAEALFDAHAEEYLKLIRDDQRLKELLNSELPGVVTDEILPPTSDSKPPGSSDIIGLGESLAAYTDRIGEAVRSATPKPKMIWEHSDDWRYGESDEQFLERMTGEPPGFDPGFSTAEGTWETQMEDACRGAMGALSYKAYSRAWVWALRDGRNRSEFKEILLASIREYVDRWLEQVARPTPLEEGLPATRDRAAKRFESTITSAIAVQRMDAYIKSKGIGLTTFANQAKITDRTLRTFRNTGAVRRDTFDAIAKAMDTTTEELLKPE